VSTLSSLHSQKNDKERELRKQKTRLDQLDSLQRSLHSTCDSYTYDMNTLKEYIKSNSESGFNALSNIEIQNETIGNDKESDASNDTHLRQTLSYISREITAVETKISELTRDISSLEHAILVEEERERQERLKALEEHAKNLKKLLTGK